MDPLLPLGERINFDLITQDIHPRFELVVNHLQDKFAPQSDINFTTRDGMNLLMHYMSIATPIDPKIVVYLTSQPGFNI